LSNNGIVGTEKLTDIEKAAGATATVVGVNGDFFAPNPGKPTGILMRNGVLESAPAANRSSLGIGADGSLTVRQVSFDGTWRGTGQRRQFDLNAPPVAGHTTLYTSAWGPATPGESGVVVDVIPSLPALVPNRVVTGVVSQVGSGGPTTIPPGGAVLVSRGGQAPHLTAEAPPGTTVEIRPTLTPNWSGMTGAIGGGPVIGANGQLQDGRIVLVTVEGGTPAYSAGMTNYELAVAVRRLGAQTAMSLGTGPSAAMAFDGSLLTRPTTGTEQPVADALFLSYYGVYAAPPSSATLSPNGDGVDDVQTFTYKLVRPANVNASVVGPDRVPRVLLQDAEQPGVHTVQWDGAGAAEGSWRFVVTAGDDLGRTTTAERPFALNQTLARLQVSRRTNGVTATFDVVHSAAVTVTVEKPNGIVVATPLSKRLDPGTQSVDWNGSVAAGYRVRVVAANPIGRAALQAPVTS